MEWVVALALGILPGLVWLVFFLREDDHPEPKTMILKVFVAGGVSAIVALLLQALTETFFKQTLVLTLPQLVEENVVPYLAFSLIEEGIKFLLVFLVVRKSVDFDEPVDAMIYMIVAALGFAAAENIGYILQNSDNALNIAYWRFLSATFLHTAASAIVGYFFAVSVIKQKHHFFFIMLGLIIASLLHALFNFLIITAEVFQHTAVSLLGLIIVLFCIVAFLFHRIKKMSFDIR